MKKLAILCALALMLVLTGCNQPAPVTPKVAVVDPGKVFQESVPGKAGVAYLESISKEMQGEFVKLQTEVRETKSKEAQMKLQQLAGTFQQRMNAEQQQVIGKLQSNFTKVLDAYRQQNKFDVVIAKEQALSFDATVDITGDVLAAMDKISIEFKPMVKEAKAEAAPAKADAAPKAEEKKAE